MKIQVDKEKLGASLSVASIAVASSGEDDLQMHYLFRIRDGNVELLTYNQRICASAPIECEIIDDGNDAEALTIESRRLQTWLSGIGDGDVTLSTDGSGEVLCEAARSKIHVQSMDPKKFPFWDGTLEEAKETATVSAKRLSSAFGYARHFISDQDSSRPEISQTEVLEGAMWATDKRAVTLIAMDFLKDSNLRVHGKDIPAVVKFLSIRDEEDVTILEHDRCMFLRRQNGDLFAAARPLAKFPTLKVDRDGEDGTTWEVDAEDFKAGNKVLAGSTEWGDSRRRLTFDKDKKQVVMSVQSAAGGHRDEYDLLTEMDDSADGLSGESFEVNFPYLEGIIEHFDDVKTLKFGVSKMGKGGFIRFRHETDDNDLFLTVVVWRL